METKTLGELRILGNGAYWKIKYAGGYSGFWEEERDFIELYRIHKEEEIFVERRENWACYLRHFVEIISSSTEKYVCIYGLKDPMKEIKRAREHEFQHFTSIEKVKGKAPYWVFRGNYKRHSRAFRYIILDESLAKQIESELKNPR